MSLFDDIVKSFYLTEDNVGDEDEQNKENELVPEADDGGGEEGTDDGGDEYQMNDPEADDGGGEEGTDNNQEGSGEDNQNQEEDEYQMNDPEADDGGEDNQDTEGNEDGGTGSESTDDPSAKLKDIEKSIFDQLTPEQQAAKTKELKSLYTDTYNKCQTIVDMVSTAEKEPSQAKVHDYIINNLVDLQKYIRDYLNDIFDSKTYIENMTELQKYLAILDTINNVFEEMKKGFETQAK